MSNAGALIGNVACGPLTARVGRTRIFHVAMVFQILSRLMLALSANPSMLIATRVFQGTFADLWGPISQLYTAEIPSPDLRDALGGMSWLELAFGIFVGYSVGGLLRWDHTAFAVAGLLLTLWPLTFFLPESPVYLVANRRDKEAEAVLLSLRGPDDDVTKELADMKKQRDLELEKAKKRSIKTLFKPKYLKPLTLILLLIFLRACTGIYAVFSFVGDIFKLTGCADRPIPIIHDRSRNTNGFSVALHVPCQTLWQKAVDHCLHFFDFCWSGCNGCLLLHRSN